MEQRKYSLFILFVFSTLITFFTSHSVYAETNKNLVAYNSHAQKQELIFLMAKQHNLNFDALYWVAERESKFNPKVINPKDTDGFPAYGVYQYKMTTWRAFVKLCGFKYTDKQVLDFEANLAVTACAWEKGLAWNWGPYKEAVKRFGSVVLKS